MQLAPGTPKQSAVKQELIGQLSLCCPLSGQIAGSGATAVVVTRGDEPGAYKLEAADTYKGDAGNEEDDTYKSEVAGKEGAGKEEDDTYKVDAAGKEGKEE